MKTKKIIPGIILCLMMNILTVIHAEDNDFYVEEINSDGTTRVIDQAQTYIVAKASYDAHMANTNNIQIRQGETIWKMKYGVLLFQTSDTCDYNVTFQTDAGQGYTNGCYGIDAAYTGSQTTGYLDFYLSGVYGSTTAENVAMLPIETAGNVSNYRVEEGKLYHQIKTNMEHSYYSSIIYLGDAPAYLEDEQEYYSYDGHYFYPSGGDFSGFHEMCDDLAERSHAHAINVDEPFYQYYQYLSHRTTTNYSEEELRQYIQDTLHIKGSMTTYHSIGTSYHGILTQSLFKDNITPFLQYQDQFGTNAMMMMALAMNESATGRSYLAYSRNNLFGHAAFDSAVEENASRYDSVSKSIYSHALHYLQNGYLNPSNPTWHGAYFGNKASGMNVSYASDPYWGEKAAQYYIRMDEALGGKDKDTYVLAYPAHDGEIMVYAQPNSESEVLYSTANLNDFAFVVLPHDLDGFYMIQSDPALHTENSYSFRDSVAYVKQSDVQLIGAMSAKNEIKRYAITFDGGDGIFEDGSDSITLMCREGQIPSISAPLKDGWLFVGWDEELSEVNQNKTYHAQYAKIQSVALTQEPKLDYTVGEQLDVSGGLLTITLGEGVVKDIPLNSSMVYGFDPDTAGDQSIHINYQGATLTYSIHVKEKDATVQSSTLPRIQELLENSSIFDDLSDEAENEILSIKEALDNSGIPELSNDGIRLLDTFIQKAYGSSLQIKVSDDSTGVSVSGLSVAAPLKAPSFLPQSLHFSLSKGIDKERETLLSQVAEGNGYTLDYCFSLSLGSVDEGELSNRLLLALPKNEDIEANAYYMLLRYEDGEVYQVPISQSDTLLSFHTDQMGDYALAYRLSNQTYGGNDIVENNSVATNGLTFLDFLFWAGIGILVIALIAFTFAIRKKRKNKKGDQPKQPKRKKQKKQRKQAQRDEMRMQDPYYQNNDPYANPSYPNNGGYPNQDPYANQNSYGGNDPYGSYPDDYQR